MVCTIFETASSFAVSFKNSDLSGCLKFAQAPCLSLWERCLEEAERVNCTIVTRTNFVTTNALPRVVPYEQI